MYKTNDSGADVDKLTTFARQRGWKIFPAPKVSDYGVPFVKNMYMDAATRVPNCSYYAYSNGDILYSNGIVDTLKAVSQVCT